MEGFDLPCRVECNQKTSPARREVNPINLLGLSGSITDGSRTRAAVERALEGAGDLESVSTDLLHLGDHELVTADGRSLDDYTGDTRRVLERVIEADGYLLGTPVYRGSYSGLLKNLLDMIPRGRWQADVAPFENAPVGLIATGATEHHFLSIDQELRPVMAFFGAYTLPGGVYLHDEHFDEDPWISDPDTRQRLQALGAATAALGKAIQEWEELRQLSPQV